MSKKSEITPEEKALFESAVSHTSRIKQDKLLIKKEIKSRPLVSRHATPEHQPTYVGSYDIYLQNLAPDDWLQPEDTIHFARDGVQQRALTRLKKGQLPIEARLDLHGLTADEAIASAVEFIAGCVANDIRVILLVHGKGQISSENGPILKNLLNQWLREQTEVLAFHSCQSKDGGTGALYVLLKRMD